MLHLNRNYSWPALIYSEGLVSMLEKEIEFIDGLSLFAFCVTLELTVSLIISK